MKSIHPIFIILFKGGKPIILRFLGGSLLIERLPVDKRKLVAKNKYESVHEELLEVGTKLLSSERLTEISLNSISEYTNISKTTIYEHFNSSFNVFLSEVILHVWKKIRKIYYGKTNEDPISNILLIFRTWHEFNFENLLLARNIYASYILFVDTEYFPITNVLTDIEAELSKLNFNAEDTKEIIRIFYISVDEILGNPDVRNIDNVMEDIQLFLNNKKS